MIDLYILKKIPVHWQYFICAIVCYKLTVMIINYFKNYDNIGSKNKDKQTQNKTLQKEIAKVTEDVEDSDYDEDSSITPALPKNLKHIPYIFNKFPEKEMIKRSEDFYNFLNKRRTVRHFSSEPVPIEIIRNIIHTAGTAPSGAHTEPWLFISVSSPEVKQQIREIIEQEEEINYKKRMSKKWITDLKPLRTNWIKEYLTEAPYLILVFKQMYSFTDDGQKRIHYYNEMSVNIAVGILFSAIHNAGLVSLTSTPLNCGPAIRLLLDRPTNEKLLYVLPVGYPAKNCLVPDLKRKPLQEILIEI